MKRSLNILMALMLSLMVVYLSVGTTVIHCLHYDKVIDYLIFPYLQIGCKSFSVLLQPRLSYAYPYQKNLRVAYIYKMVKSSEAKI